MEPHETNLYYGILLTGSSLILLVILFFKGSIAVQRRLLTLNAERMQSELICIEAERKRIAADLHDDTNGILYDLLRKTERILPADEKSKSHLGDLYKGIRYISESVHKVIAHGNPIPISQNGLSYALQELALTKNGTGGLRIMLESCYLPALPADSEIQLYRIAQEIIQNTIKHANAKNLVISTEMTRGYFRISFTDDGRGMDKARLGNIKAGRGLGNIYNRARLIGAKVELQASPGCTFIIELTL